MTFHVSVYIFRYTEYYNDSSSYLRGKLGGVEWRPVGAEATAVGGCDEHGTSHAEVASLVAPLVILGDAHRIRVPDHSNDKGKARGSGREVLLLLESDTLKYSCTSSTTSTTTNTGVQYRREISSDIHLSLSFSLSLFLSPFFDT